MEKTIDEKYFTDTNIYEMDVKNLLKDDYSYYDLETAINEYMGDAEYKKIAKFNSASFGENMMSQREFEIWRDDPVSGIGKCGQLTPIALYKGTVIDGRNRVRALLSLGVDKVQYRKVRNNLKKNDLDVLAAILGNKKQISKTQHAFNLYIGKDCHKLTKKERLTLGKSTGGKVSPSQLERVHSLVGLIGKGDPKIELLRQGGGHMQLTGKSTTSLQAIVDDIRLRQRNDLDEMISLGSNPSEHNRSSREYKKMKKTLSGLLDNDLNDAEKLAAKDVIKEIDLFTIEEHRIIGAALKDISINN